MSRLVLRFLFIIGIFTDGIVSQGVDILQHGKTKYNYQLSTTACNTMTETAFNFNKEVSCLINKYQTSKAQACKESVEVGTVQARTTTQLSETLKSDLQKIKEADTITAGSIALCQDETCLYVRQLEGYYRITSAKEASLKTITSLKENGLKEIKEFMDKCV